MKPFKFEALSSDDNSQSQRCQKRRTCEMKCAARLRKPRGHAKRPPTIEQGPSCSKQDTENFYREVRARHGSKSVGRARRDCGGFPSDYDYNRQADEASAGEASQNIQEVPYKTVRLHREKAQGDRIGLSPFLGLDTSRGSGGARPRRGKRFFRLK